MNYSFRLISILAGCLLSIGWSASGQDVSDQHVYTKAEVSAEVNRLTQHSDQFSRIFDRALALSPIEGAPRANQLNEKAKKLNQAIELLSNYIRDTDQYQD